VSEAGLPGFEMSPWFGVLAPAGTPRDIVTKLNAELVRILRAPDIAAQFRAQGVEPAHSTPQEFLAVIEADLKKWGKVIAEAGIRGE
jgi:tripartite-type tricarboxylate transporter receptor subunit TctC